MNFYETEILDFIELQNLGKDIDIEVDASKWVRLVSERFPFTGSRIAWDRVPNSVVAHLGDGEGEVEFFMNKFRTVVQENSLVGCVVHVGDSLTDFSIAAELRVMEVVLPVMLEVPQHHYLVDRFGKWCMSFSMEGDFGFGFSANLRTELG